MVWGSLGYGWLYDWEGFAMTLMPWLTLVCCLGISDPAGSGSVPPLMAMISRVSDSPMEVSDQARMLSGRTAIALHADTLAGVTDSNQITLWDWHTGQILHTLEGHQEPILALAFSPDGHYLFSSGHDHLIHVWDVQTGDRVQSLAGNEKWIDAIAVTPDGHTLISGGGDYQIRRWLIDPTNTPQVPTILGTHTSPIQSLAISTDGQILVSGSWDEIKVWDLTTGLLLQSISGLWFGVDALAITADQRQIISGTGDGQIRVWDRETGTLQQTLIGHRSTISAVLMMPDQTHLITSSWDNTIRIWNWPTGDLVQTLPRQLGIVEMIAIADDGHTLLSGSWGNVIQVWNWPTGELVQTLQVSH